MVLFLLIYHELCIQNSLDWFWSQANCTLTVSTGTKMYAAYALSTQHDSKMLSIISLSLTVHTVAQYFKMLCHSLHSMCVHFIHHLKVNTYRQWVNKLTLVTSRGNKKFLLRRCLIYSASFNE